MGVRGLTPDSPAVSPLKRGEPEITALFRFMEYKIVATYLSTQLWSVVSQLENPCNQSPPFEGGFRGI
jgi:hypothetical protein